MSYSVMRILIRKFICKHVKEWLNLKRIDTHNIWTNYVLWSFIKDLSTFIILRKKSENEHHLWKPPMIWSGKEFSVSQMNIMKINSVNNCSNPDKKNPIHIRSAFCRYSMRWRIALCRKTSTPVLCSGAISIVKMKFHRWGSYRQNFWEDALGIYYKTKRGLTVILIKLHSFFSFSPLCPSWVASLQPGIS